MFRRISSAILLGVIFCTTTFAADCGKILVILSDRSILPVFKSQRADATFVDHPTGYFLSEMVGPLRILEKLGYSFEFATPSGDAAVADPISLDPQFFGGAEGYAQALQYLAKLNEAKGPGSFRTPRTFAELQDKNFEALVVPGGHAAMVGLPDDPQLGKILLSFHNDGKPTALICHGPCALLAARYLGDGRPWPYKGYRMTAFSTPEEKIEEDAGVLGGYVQSYPENALRRLGGVYFSAKEPWQPFAIRDRELITGQNPASHEVFSNEIVEALMEKRLQARLFPKWTGKLDPKLQAEAAYVLGLDEYQHIVVDWTSGYTTLFVGRRKAGIVREKFLETLSSHVREVSDLFSSAGLKGYLVWTDGETEVAYQNWTSEGAAAEAFKLDAAKKIVADASGMMDFVTFKKNSETSWLNQILPFEPERIPDAH